MPEEEIAHGPLPGELGISGTPNYFGNIYSEVNPSLYSYAGYGTPGTRSWGAYEEMGKTDPDVAAALDFLQGQIRNTRVDVEEPSPAQTDRALAKAQTEFLRWNLLERVEPGWGEILRQMTHGLLPGFALHELVAAEVRHPALPGGMGWGLVKLAERRPVSVHATNGWLERDGELYAIRQLGPRSGEAGTQWVDLLLPAEKCQLMSWNREGNNYLGVSAFRAVYYVARVRAQLLRLVGISYMREGAGIPCAESEKIEAKLTPKQRQDLRKLLSNSVFHENAAVVMPAGWHINWVYSPGANKGHVVEAWQQLGLVILRQLQAQQVSLGVNGTGSRSVGEVHAGASEEFAAGVMASFEGVINGVGRRPYTGLTQKIIDWNWGAQPAYPRLTIRAQKTKLSVLQRATAMRLAAEAGILTITVDDENVLRDALGLKPIDATARRLAPPPPPPSPSPLLPALAAAASRPFVPSRPLRATERVLDLQGITDYLDNARLVFERDARPLVAEMLMRAMPDITAAMADGEPSEMATLALDTKRLAVLVGEYVEGVRAQGGEQVRAEIKRGKSEDVADERREENAPPASPVLKGAAAKTETILDSVKSALLRRLTNRLRTELEEEAVETLRRGDDDTEVVTRTLARQVETGAFRNDAGSVTTRVWNLGRDEAAAALDVGEAEYSAILDGVQCMACDAMDGRVFEMGTDEYDANLPPYRDCAGGPRCRCLYVYLPGTGGKS